MTGKLRDICIFMLFSLRLWNVIEAESSYAPEKVWRSVKIVPKGSSFELICEVHSSELPYDPLNWYKREKDDTWRRLGTEKNHNITRFMNQAEGIYNLTLQILEVDESDEGDYKCDVQTMKMPSYYTLAIPRRELKIERMEKRGKMSDYDAVFSCVAVSDPKPNASSIKWFKGDGNDESESNFLTHPVENSTTTQIFYDNFNEFGVRSFLKIIKGGLGENDKYVCLAVEDKPESKFWIIVAIVCAVILVVGVVVFVFRKKLCCC